MTEESDDLGDRSRRGSQGQVVRAAEGLADAFNPAPQVLSLVAGEKPGPIVTGNSTEHLLGLRTLCSFHVAYCPDSFWSKSTGQAVVNP